jgi:hypothetical protein
MSWQTVVNVVLEAHAWYWHLILIMFMLISMTYAFRHLREWIRNRRKLAKKKSTR